MISMPVDLSIKDAPDFLVERLRARAEKHHRSLEHEVLAIIEKAVAGEGRTVTSQLLTEVQRLGIKTPREAVELIRADRDGR